MSLLAALILVIALTAFTATAVEEIYVQFGTNLGSTIPSRIESLLLQSGAQVHYYDEAIKLENAILLAFGNSSLSTGCISLTGVLAEGSAIKSCSLGSNIVFAADGLPIVPDGKRFAMDVDAVHYGAAAASYQLLEQFGFAFIHPLQTFVPSGIRLPSSELNIVRNPRWPIRTWHIHTQHPLEFQEVLNGFDIPMFIDSELSRCGTEIYCERFESMLPSLSGLFEWAIANGQNRVESLLLGNKKWNLRNESIAMGEIRQNRLKQINELAHQFGVLMGADIPIAFLQQHAWAMINVRDDVDKQIQDINNRIDWAFKADFDFLSTESGLSEFTKPSCDLMLTLFNAFSTRIAEIWGREAYTKVHCSTNEFCKEVDETTGALKYPDPRTVDSASPQPINFNLLPTYADGSLGALIHTIQVYSFDDPTAGAYGNSNFSYMSDYMMFESSLQKRNVLYYGESAYWVNVDIDVPLFLPLSGQRRLYDLRRTARQETASTHINGQMNFESGWEFGYWISNVITARSVYDPLLEVSDDWEAFSIALRPIAAVFTSAADPLFAQSVIDRICSLAKLQADIMVDGKVNGEAPSDITKLSGHAYLSGADTWVDLPRMLGLGLTQPDKIHIKETDDPNWPAMMNLLTEMKAKFGEEFVAWSKLHSNAADGNFLSKTGLSLLKELVDSVGLISLRASQVWSLYKSADPSISRVDRNHYLNDGRTALLQAADLISNRKANFRVTPNRTAAWRDNPTVYPYGYLWAATSQYYWWRDQGQAESADLMSAVSPCYLNRMEPLELVFGWGKVLEQELRMKLIERGQNGSMIAALLADCLAPPLSEFEFPRDL